MTEDKNCVSVLKDSQQAKIREILIRLARIANTLDEIPGLIDTEELAMGYSLIGKSYVDLNNEISEINYVLSHDPI